MMAPARKIMLVHGAMHGPWCWHRVIPLLERDGFDLIIADLRKDGAASLREYESRIVADVQQAGRVDMIVAHSFGGLVALSSAPRIAPMIGGVMLLAALLPEDGKSAMDLVFADTDSDLMPALAANADGGSDTALLDAFYNDCDADSRALARLLLTEEPLDALTAPANADWQGMAGLRTGYVSTRRDHIVSPAFQTEMRQRSAMPLVAELDTSHSPFFSAPDQLAKIVADFTQASDPDEP